ncbi:hypothetical protein VHUM_01763 [Vanrija humicola]|uniref:Uncharacterized protein n=1 Tax=Vanrija humicola TaxID=5417 RepID=A0A7D8V0A5_VANHU|nr:hypothetical protein VHUM_01763 [Vanrija humicola]
MSSPFNPLTALTPGLHATPGLGASPSVPLHPFLLPTASPAGAAASPGTLLALAGSYSAPLSNLAGTPLAPGAAAAVGVVPLPVPLPGGTNGPATPQTEADDTLRALPDISRLLERAEAVRAELSVLEAGVFGTGEGADDTPALQLDYAQTLLALIQLGGAYLVGALPVPLAAAVPTQAEAPPVAGTGADAVPAQTPAPTSGVGALPTPAQLASFAEGRAAAMFARREGVKTAAKAVQDVLKGSGGR